MKHRRRLDLYGALAGALLGITDTATLLWLGVDMRIAERDATLLVGAFFSSSFAVLGYLIGRLILARAKAREDAHTIRAQADALEASRRDALQNEKLAAIGRLAAGVAHEVRNPLGVIRASSAMVQESFEPGDESYRACQFVLEEIDRLDGLIASLLNFARPVELRLSEVRVEKVIDRALQLASPALTRCGAEVVTESAGHVPALVADGDLLAQVVLGLVTNAAECVRARGHIVVRVEAADAAARIDVADDGPGVAPEVADRVFEPFFTTKPKGTGLGLAMAARIVQAHAGRLEVVQRRGAGSAGAGACFRLELPLAAEAADVGGVRA